MIAVAVDAELGPVRWCADCGDLWPADDEFYERGSSTCRACVFERKRHGPDRERRLERMRIAAREYRRTGVWPRVSS